MFGANITKYFTDVEDSSIFIGKTQLQIAKEVIKHTGAYTYSFDYTKYDQVVPLEIIATASEIV